MKNGVKPTCGHRMPWSKLAAKNGGQRRGIDENVLRLQCRFRICCQRPQLQRATAAWLAAVVPHPACSRPLQGTPCTRNQPSSRWAGAAHTRGIPGAGQAHPGCPPWGRPGSMLSRPAGCAGQAGCLCQLLWVLGHRRRRLGLGNRALVLASHEGQALGVLPQLHVQHGPAAAAQHVPGR